MKEMINQMLSWSNLESKREREREKKRERKREREKKRERERERQRCKKTHDHSRGHIILLCELLMFWNRSLNMRDNELKL